MAYDKDQNEFALPAGNNADRSASNFLPKYFRTDTNKKFISSTIDQMINPGVVEKIDAFAGRRYAKARTSNDSYLKDVTVDRENYQFEPVTVHKDDLGNVEFLKNYNDYISQIRNFKGSTSNHSLLNSQEFYAWNPHIDWDKFVNFREYYWLPNGPQPIAVVGQSRDVVSTYTVNLVVDGDNSAYVFNPNGFTRNPTLKLYKGQKYRFEIDVPGHPISIAISKTFIPGEAKIIEGYEGFRDPSAYDSELYGNEYDIGDFSIPPKATAIVFEEDKNVSTLYNDGIVKFDEFGNITDSVFIEKGAIEFTIPDNAPTNLYYISKNDINTSGNFTIYGIEENTEIDVENEIVGKKNYKTSSGVELSNGMKIYFQGRVTPVEFSEGYWYVEGVGSSIKLVAEKNLEVPAIFTSEYNIPFDNENIGFDQYPFEDATSFPGTKDYIVVNRSSADRNPWARYNRWFHRDVIEASNSSVTVDENARAKRPIIEFEAGLKLFNHGTKAKKNVDLVDTFTKDIFSTIEGSLGYNVDGVDLADGMRILFTADTDKLVNGKIYNVKFITHKGRRQISLIETDDSTPNLNEVVLVLSGSSYKGKMFYYNGTAWAQSQEKTKVNQPPLFDLFDKDGNSFVDSLTYPASSFKGNKVFSYRVGNSVIDSELGFSLSYQNISNVGDIVFDFNLLKESFSYQDLLNESKEVNTDIGYLRVYDRLGENFVYSNGWKKAIENSKQAVIRNYEVVDKLNNFLVDVFDNSGLLTDLVVKVYVNGFKKVSGVDYTIENINNNATVIFTTDLVAGDVVLLKCYSLAKKNNNGFYEIPINFEKNPLNENITEFTLGQVNDHLNSIVEDHPVFVGTYPGSSNLRDIGVLTPYGKRFVQHSGPVNLALYHITDKNSNIVKSLKFARREYAKFKRQFLNEASKSGFYGSVKDHVDLILSTITKDKTSNMPFYFSDMLGVGAYKKTVHTIEYNGPAYFALETDFNLDRLSTNAVGVYLNGNQLLFEKDYIFTENFVYVKNDLLDGDIVEVYEYETTNGSHIPPTPTKLGLYPKFEPQMYVDNTYIEPRNVIQGHDGSIIVAFNDYRDDLIIELEKRIFNNIKIRYNEDLINLHDFVGGINRNTNFLKSEIDSVMLSDFAQWVEISGSPDYSLNNGWDQTNSFTYNYSLMTDTSGIPLDGYWRSIYKKYFDTDRPHTHPWEMLGFTIKPSWWESVYGPAPYTKDNLILWTDLQEGIIREPNKVIIRNKKYSRPNLLNYIPVDQYGRLLSPLSCGLAQDFSILNSNGSFKFGDEAPVETAWRRSSEFPFSLLTAWVLLQPTKIIGLGFDYSRIERDITGNIVYKDTQKRIALKDLVFPNTSINETPLLTAGFVNYIANYMVNKVGLKYNSYKEQVNNIDNQLAIKLGGFADKTKLKLVLDSRSPLNKTSVFVPDENYQIVFNTSSALDIAVLSGIIIEKTSSGYIISGYDKEDPVFSYYKPIERQQDSTITVGGISETFVTWNENQEYPNGTIVEYEGRYYRTKITHRSTSTFDSAKFVILPSLPIVGGITAKVRKVFEKDESVLPYGTLLTSVQDVVDFMYGYESYLIGQGFNFEFFNSETETLEDMQLCIKEFMFWVTQNWDIGTVLTISPVANKVVFKRDFFVVDDIYDTFYDYNLLTGDGIKLNKDFSNIFRNNSNEFGVKPINVDEGIFLVKLPLVQKEHVVLIDNRTVFNDIIFDKNTGYRQERIKIVGYRTDNWNGGLNVPGFIYDDAKVKVWNEWTDYAIGDIVKYKEFYYSANIKHTSNDTFDANNWNILNERPTPELLPNWDYRVNQFTDFYSLDTDNFDSEQQRLGQHLIGYQKREYLSNIITDSVSQYKFYQGFIQDKGTKNALTKLFDALSSADKDSLEFYEEWAIRLGQYGSIENIQEVEYVVDESKYRLEPQLFELVNTTSLTRTDLVYEIPSFDVYLKPFDYNHKLFVENSSRQFYVKDNGYVRDEDVSYISVTKDQLLDLDIDNILIGEFVWVTDNDQSWTVLRHVKTDYKVIDIVPSIPDEVLPFDTDNLIGFTVYFDQYTTFVEGDIVGIKSAIPDINGFFKVKYASLNEVIFLASTEPEINDFTDSTTIGVSKFVERRFTNSIDLNDRITDLRKDLDDTIWLDDAGNGRWATLKNKNIFSLQEETLNPTDTESGFSTSFDATESNNLVIVGSPLDTTAKPVLRIYKRFVDSSPKTLFQTLQADNTIDSSNTLYGYDVSISPDGEYIAVGVPHASNALTLYKGELTPGVTYPVGSIVSDRGVLWKAKVEVTSYTDSSTITNLDQDWEPAYLIETTSEGSASGLTNQGAVYIYKKQINETYALEHCIVSPTPKTNERFGYSVELRKTTSGTVRLFVGAPGEENVDQGKIYFLDTANGGWSYSVDRNYKGLYSDDAKYNTGDIVYYNGVFKTALTNFSAGSSNPDSNLDWLPIDVDSYVEYSGFIPRYQDPVDAGEADIYATAKNIGKKLDINKLGDILIMSAVVSDVKRVSVYRNNNNRWTFVQFIDTTDKLEDFGYSIAINDQGNRIAIGAPRNDSNGIDAGIVYIFNQTNDSQYQLTQRLKSPFEEKNEAFGTGIDFYNNKIAISGKNTDRRVYTTFDRYFSLVPNFVVAEDEFGNLVYSSYVFDKTSAENEAKTTFDGGNTRFVSVTKDTGRIALFQQVGDNYIYAEDVDYNRNTKFNDISNFKLINNHIYLGLPKINPAVNVDSSLPPIYSDDLSTGLFVDVRAEKNADSWVVLSQESGMINISKIKRCFLYSKDKNDILTSLDIIDPRQGKIAGPAEQEIDFKTFYDPAIYSVNETNAETNEIVQGIVVDSASNWTEENVGKLWWNLSTVSWYNPYQGDIQYRRNNWNRLTYGSVVDVFEWVGTDLLPSEWNQIADTNEGFARGISGTSLYGNGVYSSKEVYDPVARTFRTKYFYWVRNNRIVPQNTRRRLSAYDVASLIRDPENSGYRFIAPLDVDKFALYNVENFIEGTNTVLHFSFFKDENLNTNIHNEYQLVTEGLATSKINSEIETKWFDSLIGYDVNNNTVPDPSLSVKQKYGILNFPRQGMFINRLEAVKQVVERVNSVLINNQIVDTVDIAPLLTKDEIPAITTGKYDTVVDTVSQLRFVGVAKTDVAVLRPVIENGRIVDVTIVNPGRGYTIAPEIKINDSKGFGAIIKANINNLGQLTSVYIRSKGKNYTESANITVRKFSVLVNADEEIGNRWAIYSWDKSSQSWSRTDNQAYDTTRYWSYIDWYAESYSELSAINFIVDQSYELFGLNSNIGDIVKIKNVGTGGWLLLEKIDNQTTEDYTVNYKTVGRQNGTIQLSTKLYDYTLNSGGFDASIYDNSFYDREPVYELRNILTSLRDNVFVGDLEVEWNKLFFSSMRYAFAEQPNIDWAFKTSFIRAKHNLGDLKQKVTFQNDNLENYEDYVNEIKPYSSKVREYISSYTNTEPTGSMVTDFDLPPSYNEITKEIETSIATYDNGVIQNIFDKYLQYPYRNWVDNNGYDIVRIDIANGGSGYKETPIVTINNNNGTIAKAYLSRGSVSAIEIVDKGGKYYSAPEIVISGSQDESGTPAKAVAILGNSKVRSSHVTIKFDRVSGSYFFTEINEVETFTGTGAKEKFVLKWPMDVKISSFTVLINNREQLSSEFVVGNDLDTSKGYDRYVGFIDFVEAPSLNDVVEIRYKKDINLLKAPDRINFFYNPTTGMLGKDLSQLMDGVEYSGVKLDSIGFGNLQGFDVSGYGSLPWDTFDNTYQDEVFVLDGSTVVFELSQPLDAGVEYNFYLNNVRLDDINFGTSTPVTNPNAIIPSIIGDGVTKTVTIDKEVIPTKSGDIVIIRKSTSDGSLTPTGTSYDTALSGGNLSYTTATGLASEDITVDGDGFVTPTTSKGPEEMVPGQVLDTLDIRVYHRASDGVGIIGVANYKLDGIKTVFDLPSIPQSSDGIIVKLDNQFLKPEQYSVNYENQTLTFEDSTSSIGSSLSIMCIGTNGVNLIDTEYFVSDGSTISFVTAATWSEEVSSFVTVNGEIKEFGTDYTHVKTTDEDSYPNRVKIQFDPQVLAEGDFVQYSLYSTTVKTYSQVIIDKTFEADGINNYHEFEQVPFNKNPISHNIMVKVGSNVLNPGYSITYVTTSERDYDIEAWQFRDTTEIDEAEVLVFANDQQLTNSEYTYDPVNGRIKLLSNSVAPEGTKLNIYVIRDAEYQFVDTQIDFASLAGVSVRENDSITLESQLDSTLYTVTVKSVDNNSVIVKTFRPDIRNAFVLGDQFVVTVNESDSTLITVSNVSYVLSDSLTFKVAPAAGEEVEIYQFSNHDVNNFERITYRVITDTVITEGTEEYTRRNLISSGRVPLRGTITSANYAWVAVNGELLTPNVDYYLISSLDAIQLVSIPKENDLIDIIQFGTTPITARFGFRMFKDMLNRTHYKRLNQANSYKLAVPLNYYDARILLDSTAGIFQPNRSQNIPGVIFVDGERIEYFEVKGNALLQLRRGTLGTGVKTVYNEGTVVYGQGPEETINYNDTVITQSFISDGSSILTLNYTPNSINEIDVFVGGKRLRKSEIQRYNPLIAQDSPEADETIPAEFSIDENVITFNLDRTTSTPIDGEKISVVRKIGQIWNEPNKSLAYSNNNIGRFLREATIQLPK